MDVTEVVTLDDLARFLREHKLSMTMHGFFGKFMVTLTIDGGRALTGEGTTVEEALKAAWAQR